MNTNHTTISTWNLSQTHLTSVPLITQPRPEAGRHGPVLPQDSRIVRRVGAPFDPADCPSPDSPPTPLLAFFLRYPNPFARHVLSVDVLSRTVDPVTGQILTTRLILKRGILPKWANSWLPAAGASGGRGLDAWVLEESVVDPPEWDPSLGDLGLQPRLRVQQGNLNHRKFMHVIEGGELRAGPSG